MQPFYSLLAVLASLIWLASALPSELDDYFGLHPISTVTRAATVNTSPTATVKGVFQSNPALLRAAISRCPASCSESGSNPSNWTVYHSVDRLSWCNETMLLDFVLFNSLSSGKTQKSIRACTVDGDDTTLSARSVSCETQNAATDSVTDSLKISQTESTVSSSELSNIIAVTEEIENYIQQQDSCNNTASFAISGKVAVGIFVGSQIQQQGLVDSIVKEFVATLKESSTPEKFLVQLCDDDRSSQYGIGIIADATGDLSAAQDAVQKWANGSCVTTLAETSSGKDITFSMAVPPQAPTSTPKPSASHVARALHPRSTCSTTQVMYQGDLCPDLAATCGITLAELEEYNPGSTFCNDLVQGQHVCCSSGTLPDYTPSTYSNGTCYTYTVVQDDTCSGLSAEYDITATDIEKWNTDTWGWFGCSDLQIGSYICLSNGSSPMPAPVANAICGPQVAGTVAPPAGTNLSTLNECPLNACCDVWGQCGTTTEFCTITESVTGAPGTAENNTNGCISNCGTSIVMSDAPSQFRKIAYFEGYDQTRPCLSSSVESIATQDYTHVHLGFATITSDFQVNVSDITAQFNTFITLSTSWKKILSFGGWDFSTNAATYDIFRQAVTEENRATFASNVVAFVEEYGLDGVDFDWEYPGEPDILGIPAGSEDDGVNYFLFLDELRVKFLASSVPGSSISIAAPASFWYLQGFPIEAIGLIVDYIIFMTYDLHGQWDYDNANSQDGCPLGNCLRSGVNLTETINALSMITKAGVASNIINVGVTSYGRSFQMTTAGCDGPMCTFTGPESGAWRGSCTDTAGYLGNAEIYYANSSMSDASYSFDDDSYSDTLVFGDTQWVAWMGDGNKEIRTLLYEGLNFGGTTDWAVDLQGDASTLESQCKSLKAANDTSFPTCTSKTSTTGCIAGTGSGDYEDLCEFACKYNFCPSPMCTCTETGTAAAALINSTASYCPVDSLDSSYTGLCSFSCAYGYCPSTLCEKVTVENFYSCDNTLILTSLSTNFTSDASCADVGARMYLTIRFSLLWGELSLTSYLLLAGIIASSIWDDIDATASLTSYLDSYDGDDFVFDMINPLGIGQSNSDCGRIDTGSCTAPDCTTTEAGTGWEYCTALSISNLNNVMRALYTATGDMPSNFSNLAEDMYTAFTWPPAPSMDLFWEEFMTALSTMLVVVTTLTGDVPIAAMGAFLGGVVTEGLNAILATDSQAAENLSLLADDWADALQGQWTDAWAKYIDGGSTDMITLFSNGALLDKRNIPIISPKSDNQITLNTVQQHIQQIFEATIVNKLWNADDVFLYCYPMDEDTFNGYADKWTAELQGWVDYDDGYGCYLQGISDYNVIYTYGDPPGYKDLGTGTYDFTIDDIITGSYNSFVAGGFNYTPSVSTNIDTTLKWSSADLLDGKIYTQAGVFNLLICDPSDEWTISKFYDNIGYVGYGYTASVCGCQDYADKNGKKFSDYLGIGTGCSCGGGAGCCVETGSVSICP
ncbi:hypothetical protein N7478_011653 [Penicillium angulare]|uniref:uncharacterized protein n=1 Tax=Penicillium angulare TaxID=116970 RepID=UPI00253F67D5|nr:uncharacterized protein N7478_011653 [Penicillium angulare]KAJ5261058.1 hypothetical protein N7478_011653 [Penicillium angulare]